jgi:hypothetical protein
MERMDNFVSEFTSATPLPRMADAGKDHHGPLGFLFR